MKHDNKGEKKGRGRLIIQKLTTEYQIDTREPSPTPSKNKKWSHILKIEIEWSSVTSKLVKKTHEQIGFNEIATEFE